uniref:Ig-like domain-containing protein n=1 Tax=Hucho hucho TaxID=62062 RepID=A0A4W5LCK7_9TELE
MNTTKMLSTLHTFITVSLLALCDGVMETVVGVAGRTVSLTCRYDTATLGLTEVCWGTGSQPSLFGCENTVIATNGVEVTYRRSNRHRLPGKLRSGDVSLIIYNVGEGDSGFYHCRVALSGLFNDLTHTVHLIVRQAPVIPTVIPTITPTVPGQRLPITETSGSPFTPEKSREGEQGPDILHDCTTGPIIGIVKGIKQKMASPSLESYIGHTVRVGAITFIPGLILAVLLSLRRSRNSRARGEPASSPSVRVEIPLSHHDTDAWIYDAPTDV